MKSPTRLQRWMRNLAERFATRYYEGPEPPDRLIEQVLAFAQAHPTANRGEWMGFAAALARSSYRSGYVRGLEWAERDLDKLDMGDPERLAEQQAHDFEWHAPALTSADLSTAVASHNYLDALPNDEARAYALDVLGRHTGFRVILLPPDPP